MGVDWGEGSEVHEGACIEFEARYSTFGDGNEGTQGLEGDLMFRVEEGDPTMQARFLE
jgi:hypothetical protein